jgi:hypothetical protein
VVASETLAGNFGQAGDPEQGPYQTRRAPVTQAPGGCVGSV